MKKNSSIRALSGALLALVTIGALGVAVAPAAQADRHEKPPTCTATNPNNVATADNATVFSSLVLPGSIACSSRNRVMDQFSTVSYSIQHTCPASVVVALVAPDGSVYNLPHGNTNCNTPPAGLFTINASFTVNLSSELHTGTWRLRVTDTDGFGDTGFIDTWTLTSPASTPAP